MDVRDFDFDLPAELIAQEPAAERSAARLLCLDRATGAIHHTSISQLPDRLRPGDLLVVNNTLVFPARLHGRRVPSGGAVECLLIAKGPGPVPGPVPGPGPGPVPGSGPGPGQSAWEALMHPGQKLKPGARVIFEGDKTLHGEVLERL